MTATPNTVIISAPSQLNAKESAAPTNTPKQELVDRSTSHHIPKKQSEDQVYHDQGRSYHRDHDYEGGQYSELYQSRQRRPVYQTESVVHQQSSRGPPLYDDEDPEVEEAIRRSLHEISQRDPRNQKVSFGPHHTHPEQEPQMVDWMDGKGSQPLYPRPDERSQPSTPKTIPRRSTTIGAAVQEFFGTMDAVASGNFDTFDFEKAYNLIFNLNKVKNEMSVKRVSRDIEKKKKELEDGIKTCILKMRQNSSLVDIMTDTISDFQRQLVALEQKSSQKDDLLSAPLDTSYYTRYKDGEKEKEKPRQSKAASSAPPPPPNPRQALDPRVPNPGGKMDTEEILIMEDSERQLYVRAYKVTHAQLYTMRPESLYGKYVTNTGRELYWYQGQSKTNENFYIDVSAAIGSGILADHTLYGADSKTLERPRLQSASTRDPNVKYISTCRSGERCTNKDCAHDHSTNVRTDYNWIRNVEQTTSSTIMSPFPLLEMEMKKKDAVARHMMTRDAAVRVLLINAMFGHKDFTVKPKHFAERPLRSLTFKSYRDPVEHDITEYEDY
jgi:hypothetical protein